MSTRDDPAKSVEWRSTDSPPAPFADLGLDLLSLTPREALEELLFSEELPKALSRAEGESRRLTVRFLPQIVVGSVLEWIAESTSGLLSEQAALLQERLQPAMEEADWLGWVIDNRAILEATLLAKRRSRGKPVSGGLKREPKSSAVWRALRVWPAKKGATPTPTPTERGEV